MRTGRKIFKNITSGIFNQLITLALGIIIPRLVLISLGSEANGLVNSANQVIVYLALLEGGMGLSITQALYGPTANDDHESVNGIMSAANIFYKNVGSCYFVGLLAIAVIYALTVKTQLSRGTVFLVVILTGLPQVINFYFQGKYRTLISINGYGYVLTNMGTVIYIGQSITKIVLLLMGYGLIAVQLMYCIVSLLQMFYILWFVKKTFPWLDLSVKPMRKRIGQRSSVVIHQISGFVFSNSDLVVLTYFCDLRIVSVYTMYQMFFSMINAMVGNITSSMNFVMGQRFNTDREGFLYIQNAYETLNLFLIFSCYSVLCRCILPFLNIYTAGVNDVNYIDPLLPYLFTAIQLLQSGRLSSQKVIEYAGEFRKTQWHAAVEVTLNIVVSLVGVTFLGLYGVLLGTIVALTFRSMAMIDFACKKILATSQWRIYRKWFVNIMLFGGLQLLLANCRVVPNTYLGVFLYACILMLLSMLIFGSAALLYDKTTIEWGTNLLRKKMREVFQ